MFISSEPKMFAARGMTRQIVGCVKGLPAESSMGSIRLAQYQARWMPRPQSGLRLLQDHSIAAELECIECLRYDDY